MVGSQKIFDPPSQRRFELLGGGSILTPPVHTVIGCHLLVHMARVIIIIMVKVFNGRFFLQIFQI